MGFCPSCGAGQDSAARYCPRCGAALPGALSGLGSDARPVPGQDLPASGPPAIRRRGVLLVLVASIVVLAIVGVAVVAGLRLHKPGGQAAVNASKTRSATVQHSPTLVASSASPSRSTTTQTFASLFQQSVGGVVRIDASTCSGSGVGSGFLLSPTLVATAAHVVDGAVSIGLTAGGHTVVGHVIGINDSTDVALVQASAPLAGHVFAVSVTEPPVGTPIGVIGYPEGGPVSFSQGSISGLDRTIDVQGQARSGLMQTDAAINPGNSGGPVLLVDGTVVGLADAVNTQARGIGYAVPTATSNSLFTGWRATPVPPSPAVCSQPLGPSGSGPIQNGLPSTDALAIASTLSTYFNAIDGGDYPTAWAQFSRSQKSRLIESSMASGDATSYDFNVAIQSIRGRGPGTEVVDVSFTSLQSPAQGPNGDSCDNWTLEYTMVNSGGTWLIDYTSGQNGRTHSAC